MKYYLRMGLTLLLIAVIAGGILAVVNDYTAPIIKQTKLQTEVQARREVLPSATFFVKDSIAVAKAKTKRNPLKIVQDTSSDTSFFIYYKGFSADSTLAGYCYIASLYGYSSNVKTMVGVTPEMTINKIKVISQQETPGLGANCEKAEFQAGFNTLDAAALHVDKDGGAVKSITGATITSRAITNSIRAGLEILNKQASGSAAPETQKEV
ncbi:MAG: RnfABCDGE type electron transport complex subunit G [Candidatus Cloacimonetes bacterium]|nr:RnfABCDGE type electron transport complex subunit G [Candidatus Cloacimonadota bacterium]